MPLVMIIVLMMSSMTMMIAIDEVVRFQQVQVDANALPHDRHGPVVRRPTAEHPGQSGGYHVRVHRIPIAQVIQYADEYEERRPPNVYGGIFVVI